MPSNVPGWTQAALGHSMTPDEFKANPQAQEAVFRDQMQRSLQLYGPKDAASIWFTGKPYNVAGGAVSDGISRNADYVARATAGLDGRSDVHPHAGPRPDRPLDHRAWRNFPAYPHHPRHDHQLDPGGRHPGPVGPISPKTSRTSERRSACPTTTPRTASSRCGPCRLRPLLGRAMSRRSSAIPSSMPSGWPRLINR